MSQAEQEARDGPRQDLPAKVEEVISDEALRSRIRKIIEAPPPDPFIARAAKHPLLTLILGFLLTWGVGTLLTNRWEQARQESHQALEKERVNNERRLTAFNELFGLAREYEAYAYLMKQALERDAPATELKELIQEERKLFAKTNAQAGLVLFTLRDLMPPETYERITEAFDLGIYAELQLLGEAHATEYENKLRQKPKLTKQELDKISGSTATVGLCGHALAEAVWYSALARPDREGDLDRKRELALNEMDDACVHKTHILVRGQD